MKPNLLDALAGIGMLITGNDAPVTEPAWGGENCNSHPLADAVTEILSQPRRVITPTHPVSPTIH